MTENELTSLQKKLQQLLDKQNYADLFKVLAKYNFFKGHELSQLQNAVIGGHIDQFFHQRVVIFVHKCLDEEREKLNVQLDETILRKEQTIQEQERKLKNLLQQVGEQEGKLKTLQQQIREAEGKLASLPAQIGKEKSTLESLQQRIREAEGKLASLPAQASPAQETEAQMWLYKAEALPTDSDKILAYDKAIECKPDFAEAYYERGMVEQKIGKYHDAVTDFSKAIKYQPDFAEAYYQKGCIKSIFLSQYQESLADFTQAILLIPNYKGAYLGRGLAKQTLKMYQEAITDYKQCLQFNKTDYNALYGIALCYSMLQDKQNALQYLAEVIQIDSNYKEVSKKNEAFEWLWEDADFKRLVE
ncbi:MAG: tetratricopeptide repeat protein [Bacteroidetes bacterium]|nr:MAG: tetratricopeptide repeat protein [Bacteroidota bacterium]